jgi:hypothetical protein
MLRPNGLRLSARLPAGGFQLGVSLGDKVGDKAARICCVETPGASPKRQKLKTRAKFIRPEACSQAEPFKGLERAINNS